MTPERWRQVTEVFHAALARDAPARARHLDDACANDPALRAEVEAMLVAQAESGGVGMPALNMPMSRQQLEAGTMIGPYRIADLIGVGGMGEVYRARDTKLGRDVAVKVLPAAFTSDSERLARFEREARLLAALNHPHIAAIYGFEEADGVPALILELVDGDTLADRIARGPISVDEAIRLARQIAEALEAAHEKGVIHRDLKPANIKITPAGAVKVLDFGLAKIYAGESVGSDLVPAPTITVGTREGMILGTAAYMSPEQARGQTVDKRTDIWAFGCVLYEMLTGRAAFPGVTVSDTIAAVLERVPDWRALPEKTPAAGRRLLHRCLEKDPRRRLHDIADARIELDEAQDSKDDGGLVTTCPAAALKRGSRFAWAIAAIAIMTAGAVYLWRTPTDENVYRSSIVLPAGVQLDCSCPPNGRFALSPDGRQLAIIGVGADGVRRLWVHSLAGGSPQPRDGTEGAGVLFWSADSRSIGFLAAGKLKRIDAAGGPPLEVADNPAGGGAAWNRDGDILFATFGSGNPIRRVSASGGTPTAATTLDVEEGETRHAFPSFLPDGRHFLYLAVGSKTVGPNSSNGIYVAALDSNERKLLVRGGSNAMYARGYLFFLRQQTLMAQAFDDERLELVGDAIPVADGVSIGGQTGSAGAFSISETGILAYQTGPAEVGGQTGAVTQLTWFDRSGKPIGPIADRAAHGNLALAPDGRRAVASVFDPARRSRDIWFFDVETRMRTRSTFQTSDELDAVWSPDGSRIIFNARRNGPLDLYQKASNGVGSEEELLADDVDKTPLAWSPDGRLLLFAAVTPKTRSDLWLLPLIGDRKPFAFLQTSFSEGPGAFSPDGRWVAYRSDESGTDEVYVTPFPGPGGKWQISSAGGNWPRWHPDGTEIFYLTLDNKLMAVPVNGRTSAFEVGTGRFLFDLHERFLFYGYDYDVSRNGERILVNARVEERAPAPTPITLLVNWPAALKQ